MADSAPCGPPPQLLLPDFLSGLPPEGCFTPSAASEDLQAPTPHAPAALPSAVGMDVGSTGATQVPGSSGALAEQQQPQQAPQQQHSTAGPHSHHHQRSSSHSGDDEFDWAFEMAAADLAPVLRRPKGLEFELVAAAPSLVSSTSSSLSSSRSSSSSTSYSTPILQLKRALSSVPESDQEGEEAGADPTSSGQPPYRRGSRAHAPTPPPAAAVQQNIDTWEVRGQPTAAEEQQQLEAMALQDPVHCSSHHRPLSQPFDMTTVAAAAAAARQRRTSHGGSTGGAGGTTDQEDAQEQQQQQQARQVQLGSEEATTATAVVVLSSSSGGSAGAGAGKGHSSKQAAAGGVEEDEWELASKQRLKELAGAEVGKGWLGGRRAPLL